MQPNKLACVLTRDADSRLAAIMANLTPIQQTIDVSEVGFGAAAQISILDENTVTGASTDSLEVKPLTSSVAVLNAFAVAFLRQAPFG